MSKPPNFRFVETIVCSRCVHSNTGSFILSASCNKHDDYFIDIPESFVCDDFQLERDESFE